MLGEEVTILYIPMNLIVKCTCRDNLRSLGMLVATNSAPKRCLFDYFFRTNSTHKECQIVHIFVKGARLAIWWRPTTLTFSLYNSAWWSCLTWHILVGTDITLCQRVNLIFRTISHVYILYYILYSVFSETADKGYRETVLL